MVYIIYKTNFHLVLLWNIFETKNRNEMKMRYSLAHVCSDSVAYNDCVY